MKLKMTTEAEIAWAGIPQEHKPLILNNVWCSACRQESTLVRFSGRIASEDLVLEGECKRCGGAVSRLVEGDA